MTTNKQSYNVLMIDDSHADIRLMIEAIKISGLDSMVVTTSCYSAEEGFSALELAHTQGELFHTILLDLNMPKLGGLDLLRQIKDDQRFKRTPVFIITNSDDKSDIDACQMLGADAYFQKPTDFSRLIDFFSAMKYSLEKNQAVSIPIVEKRYAELKRAA